MADLTALPEPDAAEGAPHPRHAPRLFGHATALAQFRTAMAAGRLHHAWLITGPRGVGKATLAWKLAGLLLRAAPTGAPWADEMPPSEGDSLFGDAGQGGGSDWSADPVSGDESRHRTDRTALSAAGPALAFGGDQSSATDPSADTGYAGLPADHPVQRRLAALSEPGLLLLRRGPNDKGDQLAQQITIREMRKLKDFFHLSASEGGRRVVILDAADELNPSAANALLKELEEPPKNAVFLIICHQPHRLLPTIRSRCRVMRLGPLAPRPFAAALAQAGAELPGGDHGAEEAGGHGSHALLAGLAAGSVGEAVRMANLDGLALWQALTRLIGSAPGLDRQMAVKLSEGFSGRANEQRLDLFLSLIDLRLMRLARAGVIAPDTEDPDEAALVARLSPDPAAARFWAETAQQLMARVRHGRAVNLDPGSLILDTLVRIDEAASALTLR